MSYNRYPSQHSGGGRGFDEDVEDEFLKFQQASGQLAADDNSSSRWVIDHQNYQPSREELDFLNQSGLNEVDELPYCACCFGGLCVDSEDTSVQHKDDWDSAVENALDSLDLDSASPSISMHSLAEAKGDPQFDSPRSGYAAAVGVRAPVQTRSAPVQQQQAVAPSSPPGSPPAQRASELRATANEFVPSWLSAEEPATIAAATAPAAAPSGSAASRSGGAYPRGNAGASGGHASGRFSRVCRWKDGCTKPDCLFQHPQPFTDALCESTQRNVPCSKPNCDFSHIFVIHKPCPYPQCAFDRCPYQHLRIASEEDYVAQR